MADRASGHKASNLPRELTSFIGRRQELREAKRLLTTTRLLALTGSGGSGKTRLALRAAAEMARGFGGGAWMVLFAPIQDPMLMTQAVFGALGVDDRSAGVSLSALADYIGDKHLLLVLDNCEHLLDGCAMLASTLRGRRALVRRRRAGGGQGNRVRPLAGTTDGPASAGTRITEPADQHRARGRRL